MEILKKVLKKSLFIILPALAVSFILQWEKGPQGIAAGWILGILNLRMLTRNVEGLIGSQRATAKIVFLSITRLFALCAVILLLMYLQLTNVFGLLFGFSVVFALILYEGLSESRG